MRPRVESTSVQSFGECSVGFVCCFASSRVGLCQLLLSVCPVCSLAGFVSSCCQSALSVPWRALSALAVSLPCLFLGGLCQLLLSVCPVCFLAGFVSSCCQSALSVFWRALSALAVSLPCPFFGGLCQLLLSVCPVCQT